MRLEDTLWFFPVAVAIALVVGASGRTTPREIAAGAMRTFVTLFLVVAGVGLSIRILTLLFV